MTTMMTNGIVLRVAGRDDAAAVAHLHTAVWRDTYRTLAPPAAFEALNETHRLARWTEILSAPSGKLRTLLADDGGRVVGFAAGGSPGDAAFGGRGEVKYLYVDRSMARRGVGRRLLGAMAAIFRDERYSGMALGVVEGNDPAISFYRAMGGTLAGRYRDPGPLWRSENLVFAWDDLATLIQVATRARP